MVFGWMGCAQFVDNQELPFAVLAPLMKLVGKNTSIKSTDLAKSMFRVGLHGSDQEILENSDILERAGDGEIY